MTTGSLDLAGKHPDPKMDQLREIYLHINFQTYCDLYAAHLMFCFIVILVNQLNFCGNFSFTSTSLEDIKSTHANFCQPYSRVWMTCFTQLKHWTI